MQIGDEMRNAIALTVKITIRDVAIFIACGNTIRILRDTGGKPINDAAGGCRRFGGYRRGRGVVDGIKIEIGDLHSESL